MNSEINIQPRALQYLKYYMCIHLSIFIVLVSLAYSDGQQFQTYWAIHVIVVLGIFVFGKRKEKITYYSNLIYLILMPSFLIYKLANAAALYEIQMVYWVLNIAIIVTLYLAIPFLVHGRQYYLKTEKSA